MGILLMHELVTSCIDHLKKIGSLSYADLENVDPFHYIISKIVNIITDL